MTRFSFTLIGDGQSDRVLQYPLRWLLEELGLQAPVESQWAEKPGPKMSLTERVRRALEDYPCDLLFVHRDAEREPREIRINEIRHAVRPVPEVSYACVVPVRMTEAWFLFNEAALRRASGNPKGTGPLGLPPISKHEELPNPKELLHEALRKASGHAGRRLKKFKPELAVYDLARGLTDYSPLRQLSGFGALERELQKVMESAGWIAT